MIKFGKIIDKLIEISTSGELSEEARSSLDIVIEELVEFEMLVRDVMDDKLAMA